MKWRVTYVIPYPDFSRNGATVCANREDAFNWITVAKRDLMFLEVVIWCGPKFIRRWHMDEVYTARGSRYRWVVYKPSTGTRFYVRKKSLANDKTIGKDMSFPALSAAQAAADRGVRSESQRGFV